MREKIKVNGRTRVEKKKERKTKGGKEGRR